MKSLLLACALFVLILIIKNHFAEIASSRNDIDELEFALKGVKKILWPDSAVVFSSTIAGPEFLYKTQFAMAPVIFKNRAETGDKMILLEKVDGNEASPLDTADVLYTKTTGNLRVTLKIIRK